MTTSTLNPPQAVVALTPPTMAAPLKGCVTIDSTTPDGYLDNARAGTQTASGNKDTASAAANLLASEKTTPSSPASIVGHGSDGVIATGGGKSPSNPTQYIGTQNESGWTSSLATLKGSTTDLYLYGCHVGADDAGAQLLFDIAKVVNATVYGPTGLIYCDSKGNFALEIGSQWQVATPTTKPASIAPPAPEPTGALTSAVLLHHFGNELVMSRDQVIHAHYEPYALSASHEAGEEKGRALMDEVLWEVHTPPGALGTMITGRLKLTFGRGDRPLLKSFLIHNHVLLEDEDETNVFYRTTARFREISRGK